jgi:dienelactone hydrolase
MIRPSLLDRAYIALVRHRRFFEGGWGDPARLAALCRLPAPPPQALAPEIRWGSSRITRHAVLREGVFRSPLADQGLPLESRDAQVLLVLPRGVGDARPDAGPARRRARPGDPATPGDPASRRHPMVVHLAATGDVGFGRRLRTLALPLARQGIGAMILENPFYGRRRPGGQWGVYLREFADLLLMGRAAVEEGRALLRWLELEGYGPLGITGVSMGGQMAAVAGAAFDAPVAIISCIGGHGGAPVFTEGALSQQVAWGVLERDAGGAGARARLRELIDFSEIRQLPVPLAPEAAILIGAKNDGFIPTWSVQLHHAHWPGSELRWIDTGHVGAFVLHAATFQQAIVDALDRLARTR